MEKMEGRQHEKKKKAVSKLKLEIVREGRVKCKATKAYENGNAYRHTQVELRQNSSDSSESATERKIIR